MSPSASSPVLVCIAFCLVRLFGLFGVVLRPFIMQDFLVARMGPFASVVCDFIF